MKKLIAIFMLFNVAYGQGGWLKPNNSYGTKQNRLKADSVLSLPDLPDLNSYNTQNWPEIRQYAGSLWYWNKAVWKNVGINIYSDNGTLTADRTVSGNDLYSLNFSNLKTFSIFRNGVISQSSIGSDDPNAQMSLRTVSKNSLKSSRVVLDTLKSELAFYKPSLGGYSSYFRVYEDSITAKSNLIRIQNGTEGAQKMLISNDALGTTEYKRFVKNLHTNTSVVNSVIGTETDLMSFTIPANTLSSNGDYIEFEINIYFAANANVKNADIMFNGIIVHSLLPFAQNGGSILMKGTLTRMSNTDAIITIQQLPSAGVTLYLPEGNYSNFNSANFASNMILKTTATTSANADIVQNLFIVKFTPNN